MAFYSLLLYYLAVCFNLNWFYKTITKTNTMNEVIIKKKNNKRRKKKESNLRIGFFSHALIYDDQRASNFKYKTIQLANSCFDHWHFPWKIFSMMHLLLSLSLFHLVSRSLENVPRLYKHIFFFFLFVLRLCTLIFQRNYHLLSAIRNGMNKK